MQPRMRPVRSTQILAAAFFLLALSGCSGVPGNDTEAGAVARNFAATISTGDAGAACELLAQDTKSTLEADSGLPCEAALPELRLPGGEVLKTQAYARAAEAVLDSDVMFLTLQSDGWKITAAGCRARPDLPYKCSLEGD